MATATAPTKIVVTVGAGAAASGGIRADGVTLVPVRVRLLDACGKPLAGRLLVSIDAGEMRVIPERPDSSLRPVDDIDRRLGHSQFPSQDGELKVNLVAPPHASDVPLVVRAGTIEARGTLRFVPDLRPLIAVGIVEGVFDLGRHASQSVVPAAGLNDGFEQALTGFQREFDNGDISLAGRTSFFVMGAIKGETLLTAAYDSDKPTPSRVLQDINPDKYYPVLGDASQSGFETKSAGRLYVRVDNGRNYLLYGDFSTGDGFSQQMGGGAVNAPGVNGLPQRVLGAYSRTMTGLRGHREDQDGFVDTFVMRDSLRQAIEEYRGNGTSGPYSVGSLNAVENSEKLELIVRDRNNPSRILSITALTRYEDYTFEPFSGRILLKSPLASVDPDLNPVSLRITYEVDTGGTPFWVYGVAAQRKLSDVFELGGSYVRDDNPGPAVGGIGYATAAGTGTAVPRELRELVSANTGIRLGDNSKAVVEVAQAHSATPDTDIEGRAARFDWQGSGTYNGLGGGVDPLKWQGRAWGGASDKDFNNPASPYSNGKVDAGLRASVELAPDTRLQAESVLSEDHMADTSRSGEAVMVEKSLTARWTVDAGVRHVNQTADAALSLSGGPGSVTLPGQAPVFGGSGLNPSGAGFWGQGTGLDPATGLPQTTLNGQVVNSGVVSPAIDATTVRTGATYAIDDHWKAGAELGRDNGLEDSRTWTALNSTYIARDLRLFARVEAPTDRASAGGDYKITPEANLYGRVESTNGLAPGYALDSAASSQAAVLGIRQTRGPGSEGYSEVRLDDSMNTRDLENATGIRNTYDIAPGLKGNVMGERLRIMSGGGRGADALGGGLELTRDQWRASLRLEWRQLDATPGGTADDTTTSWMANAALARKLDDSWTALVRNYYLSSDNHAIAGVQVQNRLQIGAAFRPVERNDFDALFRYENKFQLNHEIDPAEQSLAHVLSVNVNEHPAPEWWTMGRIAVKHVADNLSGVQSNYAAWLLSGRVIRDLSTDWDVGLMTSVMGSPQGSTLQVAYGTEIGYLVARNVWASLGYTFAGFSDKDLTGSDYTQHGVYLRLRMKFDERNIERAGQAVKAQFTESVP